MDMLSQKKKKKVYIFKNNLSEWWEKLAAQTEQQEEPGRSLVDKSPQFVYLMKMEQWEPDNITVLCSDHPVLTVPSNPLMRQHTDNKCG